MKYIKDKNMINIFREIKVIQEIIIIIISKIFNNFTYLKFSILKNNLKIQISKNVNNPPIVAIIIRTVKKMLSFYHLIIFKHLENHSLKSLSNAIIL